MRRLHPIALLIAVAVAVPSRAGSIEFTQVGHPGQGGVDYAFGIGTYEVTTSQYVEFLNAVAGSSDPHGLYAPEMAASAFGCRIQRVLSAGTYTYSVPPDRASRPVNYVDWGDAARFCNWLENGRPVGPQAAETTEDGSYALNGAVEDRQLTAVQRKEGARFVLPTDPEWKKAAYFDPTKAAEPGGQWWMYPTRSDRAPLAILNDASSNSANYKPDGEYLLGSPYWTTDVGEFAASTSFYGTFDQGGNLWEWTETVLTWDRVTIRGGSFGSGESRLSRAHNYMLAPASSDYYSTGLRIVQIPEPATVCLLSMGSLALIGPTRRRRVVHRSW